MKNNFSASISLSTNGERSRTIRLWVFIFIFSLCLLPVKLSATGELTLPDSTVTISMDFQNANLKDILKIFSIQSGLNFIASEAVQDRKITLYLDKVPLNETMDKLFKANNLSFELDKKANIFTVKDWGKPQIETTTKVFFLKYATVSSSFLKEERSSQLGSTGGTAGSGITEAVKKIISEYGSVIEDCRTNSLIISDMPSRMPAITQTITALDIPQPQVMLEVEMLDVSKNAVDKIGFKFGQTPFTAILTGASMGTMWPMTSTKLPLTALRQFTPGSLSINNSSNTYTAYLDFLKTLTDTKYLARPRILTMNNETAEIKITTQETVGIRSTVTTATATSTTTEPERVETGVHLRVTPQINLKTGEITMFIVPIIKDTSTSTILIGNAGSAYYKDPEERSTKSIVRLKDGDTVIIGGLIRNERTQIVTKLPFFGDIPIIGALFRHTNREKDKQRELLVFITPHIVKDAMELAQAKKFNLPLREQNTVSGDERDLAINSTLNNFEKRKK